MGRDAEAHRCASWAARAERNRPAGAEGRREGHRHRLRLRDHYVRTCGARWRVQPPADPLAPGPFAFADAARVKGILAQAGFSEIAANPVDQKVELGTLDQAVEHCTRVGPLSRLLLEYPEAVPPVMETLRSTLAE